MSLLANRDHDINWRTISLFALTFVLLSLVFLASAQLAFAEGVDSTDIVDNIRPSTGSLMAAALETSGYAAQSQVLDLSLIHI